MDINCIILAGGKSSRLGRNKLVEKVGDDSLLRRVISRLKVFDCGITLVLGQHQKYPEDIDFRDVKTVRDVYPNLGPLGGIYSGLRASDAYYNLVVAGDMPFLNTELLGYMLQTIHDDEILVPRTGDVLEPLHAIYTTDCLSSIEYLISRGKLSLLDLFPLVKTGYLNTEMIEQYDPAHNSFFNINNEQDLLTARKLAREGGRLKSLAGTV